MMQLIGSKTLTVSSLFFLLILGSCSKHNQNIEPKINYVISERYIQELPSPFSPLTLQEKNTDWGKEFLIGKAFAKNLDLYRAITALRRAEILIDNDSPRKTEIQYEILLSYYMGRRYEEVISTFENSNLKQVTTDFPPFHDLLLILYDTYENMDKSKRACHILQLIKEHYPKTYDTLILSHAMKKADLQTIHSIETDLPLKDFYHCYESQKKSPNTASLLNAFLPGSGYLYLGQRQTAVTAFLINGLFIGAATHFFLKGNIAAGAIFTSFEAGWYFGGIYGASNEAKYYNECLYRECATPLMHKERLFPILRLNYAF